jgi:hypothetical protein
VAILKRAKSILVGGWFGDDGISVPNEAVLVDGWYGSSVISFLSSLQDLTDTLVSNRPIYNNTDGRYQEIEITDTDWEGVDLGIPATTDDLVEGSSNLYFTEERVDDRVSDLINDGTGLTWAYNDAGGLLTGDVSLAPFSTTNLTEGTNLYFTNDRVDDRIDIAISGTESYLSLFGSGGHIIEDSPLLINGDDLELPGTGLFTVNATSGAPAIAFGNTKEEGMAIRVLEKTVSLNAISTDIDIDIPSGCKIIGTQLNIEAAITGGGTTTKVGIGDPAVDPDLYGLSADLNKNTKINQIHEPGYGMASVLQGDLDVQINACDDDGELGDTALTVGSIRIRIYYIELSDLADAD